MRPVPAGPRRRFTAHSPSPFQAPGVPAGRKKFLGGRGVQKIFQSTLDKVRGNPYHNRAFEAIFVLTTVTGWNNRQKPIDTQVSLSG